MVKKINIYLFFIDLNITQYSVHRKLSTTTQLIYRWVILIIVIIIAVTVSVCDREQFYTATAAVYTIYSLSGPIQSSLLEKYNS